MHSASDYLKTALAVLLVLVSTGFCVLRLMKVQVVDSQGYTRRETVTSEYVQKIPATRGEIVDANGETLVANKASYAVVIDEKNFPQDNEHSNEILLKLAEILTADATEWTDALPISKTYPYAFLPDATEDEVDAIKAEIGVNAYATAENCMDVLCDTYGISENFTQPQQRMIAGIRFTMLDDDFSMSNKFELARGLSMRTVTKISELGLWLQGVSIEQKAERQIMVGDVLPHELGTTGPIYAENADEYLAMGYDLDATIGISGIEKAMESELQGKEGERTITFEDGAAVSDEITQPVTAGHTVKLTVDSRFQRGLQKILNDFIANFHSLSGTSRLRGDAGAVVVLDTKTGAILGEVTAPTYNLMTYSEKYEELAEDERNPLFNRATMGQYRPGSTFKTITATAGLNEGVINGSTSFPCVNGIYHYRDMNFHCTGSHGYISVAPALRVSCNSFFYELSRRLGIDNLTKYAALYGIGEHTGIETADAQGYMASPAKYRELGMPWTVGQVLQAGIGNGETMVSPLQLACVACTIANRGVRYQPYLVDSVWDYGMKECLHKTEPTVAATIELNNDIVYEYVQSGMVQASHNGFPGKYSLWDLGYDVAVKTGTPQFSSRVQDSLFLGYAPAQNPRVAFAGVIEGGEYSKYMIRSILELYEEIYGEMNGEDS